MEERTTGGPGDRPPLGGRNGELPMFSPNRFPSRRALQRTPPPTLSHRIFRWPGSQTRGSLFLVPNSPPTPPPPGNRPPAQPSEIPMSYLRHMSCVALLALSATLSPGQDPSPRNENLPSTAETPVASHMPEVRLRKLHLVRPDLIPYPIAYDVYC